MVRFCDIVIVESGIAASCAVWQAQGCRMAGRGGSLSSTTWRFGRTRALRGCDLEELLVKATKTSD